MSASLTVAITEFVGLFRDTWIECEALRAKQALQASAQSVDWEEVLKAARAEAEELFEPLLAGIHSDHPLTPLLLELVTRIRAAESMHVDRVLAHLSRN